MKDAITEDLFEQIDLLDENGEKFGIAIIEGKRVPYTFRPDEIFIHGWEVKYLKNVGHPTLTEVDTIVRETIKANYKDVNFQL